MAPALRRATPQRSSFAWLAGTWPAIVGKRLAEHTRPSDLAGGVLHIAVSGKEWRVELEGVADEFRTRVNQAWGGTVVREIRFSDDRKGHPRIRHEFDNDYTPFVRGTRSTSPANAEKIRREPISRTTQSPEASAAGIRPAGTNRPSSGTPPTRPSSGNDGAKRR
jgi:Dna[CI] antecedent, DciA